MKPNPRLVLPVLGLLAAAFPVLAQQGSVLVVLECQQPPARAFPKALKSIVVCRPTYPEGFKGNESILKRDEALFLALEQRIRELLQERATELLLLRADSEGVLADAGANVERMKADANLISSLRAEIGNRHDSQGLKDRITGGRQVRSISMTCVIGLFDQSSMSVSDYAATLVHQEVAEAKMLGGGKNVSDFQEEMVVLKALVDRHAQRFVDRLLGFQGTRRFELTGASPACRNAANLLRQGKPREAMLRGVKAWQESEQVDHQSAFVAAVAFLALGSSDRAESLCVQLRDKAKESAYDITPYEDFLELLKAGGTVVSPANKGVVKATDMLQPPNDEAVPRPVPVAEGCAKPMVVPAGPNGSAACDVLSAAVRSRLLEVARRRLAELKVTSPTPDQELGMMRFLAESALVTYLREP